MAAPGRPELLEPRISRGLGAPRPVGHRSGRAARAAASSSPVHRACRSARRQPGVRTAGNTPNVRVIRRSAQPVREVPAGQLRDPRHVVGEPRAAPPPARPASGPSRRPVHVGPHVVPGHRGDHAGLDAEEPADPVHRLGRARRAGRGSAAAAPARAGTGRTGGRAARRSGPARRSARSAPSPRRSARARGRAPSRSRPPAPAPPRAGAPSWSGPARPDPAARRRAGRRERSSRIRALGGAVVEVEHRRLAAERGWPGRRRTGPRSRRGATRAPPSVATSPGPPPDDGGGPSVRKNFGSFGSHRNRPGWRGQRRVQRRRAALRRAHQQEVRQPAVTSSGHRGGPPRPHRRQQQLGAQLVGAVGAGAPRSRGGSRRRAGATTLR